MQNMYCRISNISHTLLSNKIVDLSDGVGASPVSTVQTIFILDLTACLSELGKGKL